MHADEMEDIDSATSGDIVALFGIDCASATPSPRGDLLLDDLDVRPGPVISLAVVPKNHKAQDNMSKALNRFSKEDPTFRVHADRRRTRRSSPAWASCTSRSTSSACGASTPPRSTPEAPGAYRETITRRADSTTRTRSRPAARASTARSGASSSRSRRAASTSSSTRSPAARSRASSSPRSTRASSSA